jgi:hypothetical protein
MDVGHSRGLGTFEQHDSPMRTPSQRSRLRKESAVHKRHCEIRVRLSFDDNAAVNEVIADGELFQADVEVAGFPSEIEQCRVSFREVDAELVPPRTRIVHDSFVCNATHSVTLTGRKEHWIDRDLRHRSVVVPLAMLSGDDDVIVLDGLSTTPAAPIFFRMRLEKVWVEQCRATKAIKRHFGAKSALDYLIGEKLMLFADAARDEPTFAKELPRFLAAIWQMFNEFEISGYVASRKPAARRRLRQLLYFR